MNILTDKSNENIRKTEVEQVVREKKEFTLLGKYNLTKGYRLFCYNHSDKTISQVKLKLGSFLQCELVKYDNLIQWIWFDPENMHVNINSKNTYFEALNMNFAMKRVTKWEQGKVQELFNLKKPKNKSIDIFESL